MLKSVILSEHECHECLPCFFFFFLQLVNNSIKHCKHWGFLYTYKFSPWMWSSVWKIVAHYSWQYLQHPNRCNCSWTTFLITLTCIISVSEAPLTQLTGTQEQISEPLCHTAWLLLFLFLFLFKSSVFLSSHSALSQVSGVNSATLSRSCSLEMTDGTQTGQFPTPFFMNKKAL